MTAKTKPWTLSLSLFSLSRSRAHARAHARSFTVWFEVLKKFLSGSFRAEMRAKSWWWVSEPDFKPQLKVVRWFKSVRSRSQTSLRGSERGGGQKLTLSRDSLQGHQQHQNSDYPATHTHLSGLLKRIVDEKPEETVERWRAPWIPVISALPPRLRTRNMRRTENQRTHRWSAHAQTPRFSVRDPLLTS